LLVTLAERANTQIYIVVGLQYPTNAVGGKNWQGNDT
jgi:hypothetical protein